MNFLSLLEKITFLGILKFLIVTLMFVYSVFALLMMRQIAAMTKAVTMRDDFFIRLLGTLNFCFAILVFLMAMFIL